MMNDRSVTIQKILFFLMIFLLGIPFIQNKLELIQLAPLTGTIAKPEKEYISIKGWFSGSYQSHEEEYLNKTFGFRNSFIRINNQLAFNLFDKAKANGVIIGKNNYLYEENYIKAYCGTDFIGVDSIVRRMQQLKFIQDTLSKLHKTIMVVFAAGKASFYPEYIPEKYSVKGPTNYEYHVKLAKEFHLNYIDFNKYFVENKPKSKYPLYPQYGIHWSYYGMCIAADSMIKYIEKIRRIDMPNLYWNYIEQGRPKDTDYDIGDGMNLLCDLKTFKMAYPIVQIQPAYGKKRPSLLVVSDSYYWGMYGFGFTRAFSKDHFWYYNQQVFPEFYQNGLEASNVKLKEEIQKDDVIIIMATEANLSKLGWGFIERTYNMFKGNKSTI